MTTSVSAAMEKLDRLSRVIRAVGASPRAARPLHPGTFRPQRERRPGCGVRRVARRGGTRGDPDEDPAEPSAATPEGAAA